MAAELPGKSASTAFPALLSTDLVVRMAVQPLVDHVEAGINDGVMDRTRKRLWFVGMVVALASIGFAVVVLSPGAADRWAIAMLLLLGLPLLIAMAGASDQAWRALSHQRADALAAPPAGVRRASTILGRIVTGASGVIYLVVAALLARFAISAWATVTWP